MAALRARRRRADRGAAAVEFALVTPLLLVMLFGIINYGIWFADSLGTRQGARDAARDGAVENFSGGCASQPFDLNEAMANLACAAVNRTSLIAGTAYARVGVYANATATELAPAWAPGADLRVCITVVHSSILPLVPLPNGGVSHVRVDMPIETAQGGDLAGRAAHQVMQPAPPSDLDWSWCP